MHCHKSFITKDTLTKHLSVHNETRNFKCGQCGKLFKRISHVREHLKIHTMDRPFNCTVCRKTFKTNVSTGTRYIISELGTTVFIVYVYVSLFKLNDYDDSHVEILFSECHEGSLANSHQHLALCLSILSQKIPRERVTAPSSENAHRGAAIQMSSL